jgi:phospholipase C
MTTRRDFPEPGTGAAAPSSLPFCIQKALAAPASVQTGTIQDVKHIVILMQENRSFDHYFGALRGVRGFGDRFPIPLASGKSVWYQSDGSREIPPYRLDNQTMYAGLIPETPHDFPNAQAAWNQGKFGFWPRFKTKYSMGYFTRDEAPFQYALAESFTICDAYYCSVASGTDPNRVAFFSGSNFNPELRANGTNSTDADSEPINLRCWVTGAMPSPGYRYRGTGFKWPTIPDVLEKAGVSWRIYQDPNDNWSGAMHGCLAFESFRTAEPGSPVCRNGLAQWSLTDLANDVRNGTLPQVCWVLPTRLQSEHPGAPSTPADGGNFTRDVLDALTSNPDVWSGTVFLLMFDENDGLFDHVPPPAVPSYNVDGSVAGKATLDVAGMYFINNKDKFYDELSGGMRQYLDPEDTISGNVRPWGLGPRVPMYVVSPWSKGGWVNSQVFDHTSIGQFLEKRFGITIPAITPWHRAVCGDLTSAFDFVNPNDPTFPALPDMSNSAQIETQSKILPAGQAPATPQPFYQEPGPRYSRALPYELDVSAQICASGRISLGFRNTGKQGAVFHVYDKLHLDQIPRRYTVEAGKELSDDFWNAITGDNGRYDLWVYGANGFIRTFKGTTFPENAPAKTELELSYDSANASLGLKVRNTGADQARLTVVANAYRADGPWKLTAPAGGTVEQRWSIADSGCWYDFTITDAADFERRFAGRLESGKHGISDPAMGLG